MIFLVLLSMLRLAGEAGRTWEPSVNPFSLRTENIRRNQNFYTLVPLRHNTQIHVTYVKIIT